MPSECMHACRICRYTITILFFVLPACQSAGLCATICCCSSFALLWPLSIYGCCSPSIFCVCLLVIQCLLICICVWLIPIIFHLGRSFTSYTYVSFPMVLVIAVHMYLQFSNYELFECFSLFHSPYLTFLMVVAFGPIASRARGVSLATVLVRVLSYQPTSISRLLIGLAALEPRTKKPITPTSSPGSSKDRT
jgi:hypothetical protein